jgi:hypothetical protein
VGERGMTALSDREGGPRASWQRVVVDGLEAGGYVARHRGADHVDFHCPNPQHGAGNGDRNASGGADYKADRECTDIYCHSGCATEDVLAAVGCTTRDLFDYPRGSQDQRPGPARPPRPRQAPQRKERHLKVARPCGHPGRDRRSEHPYEDGERVRYTMIRLECPVCGKRSGTYCNPSGVPPEQRIIYRLPAIRAAIAAGEVIYLCEGEKGADWLAERGCPASCNPFGADDGKGSKWLPQMTEALTGAGLVIIVADHDGPGYVHAAYVRDQLETAGIRVRVVRSATGQPKDDIIEHLQAGHEVDGLVDADPEAMLAELAGGAPASPEPPGGEDDAPRRGRLPAGITPPPGQRIPIDPRDLPAEMSLEQARRLDPGDWPEVIPKILPVGAAIIYTRPGAGKTTFSMQCEMNVAWRLPLAGYQPQEPGRCLVIDFESGMHMAILRSVQLVPFGSIAADQGDPEDLIHVCTQWPGTSFSERLAELEKRLRNADHEGQPYRLVRIDTMRAFFGANPQGMNAYDWDAGCVIRINELAEELGCCIVLIHHANKAGEISGSTALSGKCNVTYKLERRPRESEGLLKCEKNRVARELSWPLVFDLETGSWSFTDRIFAGQAAHSGAKRAIIDYLAQHGPATGPQIRAALPGIKNKTARDMLTRLGHDGWVTRREDGIWSLTEQAAVTAGPLPGPAAPDPSRPERETEEPEGRFGWGPGSIGDAAQEGLGTCAVCHGPMEVIEPGQTTHPNCDPEGTISVGAAPDPVTQPELAEDPADDVAAGPVAEQLGQDQADDTVAESCEVCGEMLTGADQHPDCEREEASSARWPAMNVMRSAIDPKLTRSRMKPVPWIPPPGHPKAEGKQTRDLPQWQLAERAAGSAEAGFAWTRPGLLEEFGPDRLVLTIDRNGSFPSGCSSVPLAPNVLLPAGRLEANPKTLGKPEQYGPRAGKPVGLAGVALVIVPRWDYPDLPLPFPRSAVPGELFPVATNLLEKLWELHTASRIPAPEVAEAFLGRRNTSLLEPFYKGVKAAREQYAGDAAMTVAVKRSSSIAIRKLYPIYKPSPWWRPDWRAAAVTESAIRTWSAADRAAAAGAVLVGLGRTDETSFLIPADANPETWVPPGYTFGRGFGQVKPKEIRVRADRVGLSGIDPARIIPARRKGYVEISPGPVPLTVWLARHA